MRIATILAALAALALLAAPAMAVTYMEKEADNFVILYDTSGSMDQDYRDSGTKKFKLAEMMLEEFVRGLPHRNYKAGLYDFTPFETYYKMGPYEPARYQAAVRGLPDEVPGGHYGTSTPFGKALRELDTVLADAPGRTVVYIITDGKNTDDLNPYRQALALSRGHDVCFYIVSLSPWADGGEQLRKISRINECSRLLDFPTAMAHPNLLYEPLGGREAYVLAGGEVIVEEAAPAEETVVIAAMTISEEPPAGPETLGQSQGRFAFDKSALRPEVKEKLDAMAAKMQADPESWLLIEGHTDSVGTEKYNMGLSYRRAESVWRYLVMEKGVQSPRVRQRWVGEADPAASNDTPEGRAMNRRVELTLYGPR